jgi:hypothetical protein
MKSNRSNTKHLFLAAFVLAAMSASTGAARATCVFNGPNCVSGTYPDLAATDAWLDAAVSQSDAGNAGANPDNLPIPAKTHPNSKGGKPWLATGVAKIR